MINISLVTYYSLTIQINIKIIINKSFYQIHYKVSRLILMSQHSIYNQENLKFACGFPLMPFQTKLDGPAINKFQMKNNMDIIDEAFLYYRVNVLFKTYEIRGPGDKLLIYLSVLISHLFKTIQQVKDEPTARKRLAEVTSLKIPDPKQKANFMAGLLQEGPPAQKELYTQYLKQLRAETVNRFLQRFFSDGVLHEDTKFWIGLSKKKFMNMNYVSMF